MECERSIGLVIIGRNEGDRLRSCLSSLEKWQIPKIYVDSGSTDDSLELAFSFGCDLVELDPGEAFSAARARNTGFENLRKNYPHIQFVQFLDGDCELDADWFNKAILFLEENTSAAIICGNRSERFPEKTIYNKLCEMEWQGSPGEISACGGDSLVRVKAFEQVDGFDNQFICGEEPELCYRLRSQGWKIFRIDEPMTLHDADMHKFTQFLLRARRSGHAYANNAHKHGKGLHRYRLKSLISILVYSTILPSISFSLLAIAGPTYAVLPALLYPLAWTKMQLSKPEYRKSRDQMIYSLFVILGKFPQAVGIFEFIVNKYKHRQTMLIEYK